MSRETLDLEGTTDEIVELLRGLNINIHIHPTASASISSPATEPGDRATGYLRASGPSSQADRPSSSSSPSGGLEPRPGPERSSASLPAPAGSSDPPAHVLRLAGRLRAHHLSGISPEARIRRAYRLGDWAIRKARGEPARYEREHVNLRNTCYVVVSGLNFEDAFYTTSYNTYVNLVCPQGTWVQHFGSHGFSSLVEVEAFFAGAGLQGLPRCLA